ncbi:integral membrane protein 2B [Trichonephila inaurata madagascariensis]|uniref:Integral membrane protein 2B n=1 Tax=Trichonephila inaurata madagascariensis TaxID=2747483 RepID=A0A8X6ISP2_9ARAC|nr:integral membrane protein 2B [Trichonephila inaurata madagascariensis]
MTIAQQFLGKKSCKQQEEPLVPAEKTNNLKDAEEGRPVVVTMHAHVRRVSSLTTLCVFATALLVLTTGIIGGMYLYRHFAHYKVGQASNVSIFYSYAKFLFSGVNSGSAILC